MGCGSSQPAVSGKPASIEQKPPVEDRNLATQPKAVNSRLDTQPKDSSAKPVYQSRVKAHNNGDSNTEGKGQEKAVPPAQIESNDEEAEDDDKVMPLPNIPNVRSTPRAAQPSFQPETNGVQWTNLYVNAGNHSANATRNCLPTQ